MHLDSNARPLHARYPRLISALGDLRRVIVGIPLRLRIKDPQFTIVSNNCWGSELYQELGQPYRTPFVGLFIRPPCYLHLLARLRELVATPLSFTRISKYADIGAPPYPIGVLDPDGEKIEIHFLHYKNETEAREKWNRRVARIRWDRLFAKFDDLDSRGDASHTRKFCELDFPAKVCFVSRPTDGALALNSLKSRAFPPSGGELYRICKREFDIAAWINSR